ncbi:hypothetical protein BASA50_009716 [Batrachochytrium salamandrivorans]|uniref:Selenoprotein O n=1 Tax=Batrachochytrium salamandrivorans TaxID=1357716 RepID=A0ABQ8F160_9FUNG|nr:hypothetical protein BASA62_004643 [Batrachochytrium salamandrivorans]KAH6590014.1 hypothetical protein BASA50_009716 [Batrachochytrium salamandrivorans]KAH6592295.1 hypothetical protein BASA61_004618 [Batrachochytrium salamandrivorans]KAH9270107.1 hypothetical protein BASA83_007782 [Batrachochytrium salamandrivorans]KAJ1336421.1 hypothetical protein BSLG_007205 [Batrachochytrium salamandrivorans]
MLMSFALIRQRSLRLVCSPCNLRPLYRHSASRATSTSTTGSASATTPSHMEKGTGRLARSMDELVFVNSLPSKLRADKDTPGTPFQAPLSRNQPSHIPRQVHSAHFSYVVPTPVPDTAATVLISFNSVASCDVLGLDIPTSALPAPKVASHATAATAGSTGLESTLQSPDALRFLDILSGAAVPNGTHPWSLAYGGHQFGSWAGQLGDGRAITLGEAIHPISGQCSEIQLKGAGMTPYSRFADGLAVLRSSIREYLCAEAMHALGVPTSRSLSLVATPSRMVFREEGPEMGAIVGRLAPSWLRFGSFELLFARNEHMLLKELADYTIETHFKDVLAEAQIHSATDAGGVSPKSLELNKYVLFLRQVVLKTADMIAHWQAVGFCHGVMNTDNFSILGLTIDYGPFQFLDVYDPTYVCNHSDDTGRYAFYEQPRIALWNLARFASVLSPLLSSTPSVETPPESTSQREMPESIHIKETLIGVVREFLPRWDTTYSLLMSKKLGFQTTQPGDLMEIYQPLLQLLDEAKMDYTHFFRSLSRVSALTPSLTDATFESWLAISYLPVLGWESVPAAVNPSTGKLDQDVDGRPVLTGSIRDRFLKWFVMYRARLVLEAEERGDYTAEDDSARLARMVMANPKYILRNHLVQNVISEMNECIESDAVDRYLKVLLHPFDEGTVEQEAEFAGVVPLSARGLKCSCSS